MTLLVTGGTGLVGSRLLRRLVESGLTCRALVRGGKALPQGVTACEGDILEPDSLVPALEGVSAVVHLAAVFRTPDEDLIWRVNLQGTRNLIAAARQVAPEARFILASTVHVYGMQNPYPGRESDPVASTIAYPASKIAAEQELRASGLNGAILRFPFVYGDGDGHLEALPGHIVGKWHPAQRMSTLHHRDIATAVKMALDGVMDGQIVNLTDEAPLSAYELVSLAGASMDPSAEPLSNPWHLQADGALARRLGFRPAVRTVYQAVAEKLL